MFYTNGTNIYDDNGNISIIRGIGLGGLLVLEPYLLDKQHETSHTNFKNHTKMLEYMESILSDQYDDFISRYRKSYVGPKDIALFQHIGINCIRLPFHYNQVMDYSRNPTNILFEYHILI